MRIICIFILLTLSNIYLFGFFGFSSTEDNPPKNSKYTGFFLDCHGKKIEFVQKYDVTYQKDAKIEIIKNALSLSGGKWTNGKDKGKGVDGNGIISSNGCNLVDSEWRVKFFVHGHNKNYAAYDLRPKHFKDGITYSSDHNWANNKKIEDDKWLYQTQSIDNKGNWLLTLSTGNYSGDNGSKVIYTKEGKLNSTVLNRMKNGQLEIFFSDNYGGKSAQMFISEVAVETSAEKHKRKKREADNLASIEKKKLEN
jgi:hypothetical protein